MFPVLRGTTFICTLTFVNSIYRSFCEEAQKLSTFPSSISTSWLLKKELVEVLLVMSLPQSVKALGSEETETVVIKKMINVLDQEERKLLSKKSCHYTWIESCQCCKIQGSVLPMVLYNSATHCNRGSGSSLFLSISFL